MMENNAKPKRRVLSYVLPVAIVLAAGAVAVALSRSTAVRVRYHAWRLDNEIGTAQRRSVDALVALGEPAVPALEHALAGARPATRNAALDALTSIDAPAAKAALARTLDSPHDDLRLAAIYSLLGSDDPGLLPAFRARLHDPSGEVARLALYAFLAYPSDVAVAELIEALKRPDTGLWREAASRLADYPMGQVMPLLVEELRGNPALAPGTRLLINIVADDDPGPEVEDLLAWWQAHRERIEQYEAERRQPNEEP